MNSGEGLLDPQQQLMLAHLTRFLVGVGLAWFTVAAMRMSATSETWPAAQRAIKEGTKIVVLRVLLPASAVLALVKQGAGAQTFATLFGIGFALTMVLFGTFFLFVYFLTTRNAAWNAGVAASMGGGNRGLATLLVLSGIVFVGADATDKRDETITAFLAVDLGNFLALLVALPLLMAMFSRRQLLEDKTSVSSIISSNLFVARWDIMPILGAIGIFLLINASGADSTISAVVTAVGDETASVRGVLVLYLAWLYVFATLPSVASVAGQLPHALLLAFLRMILAILAALGGGAITHSPPLEFATTPVGLAIIVLLISPVSSFAAVIVKQAGADDEAEQKVSELIVASTVVFLFVSFMLAIGSFVMSHRLGMGMQF